MLLKPLPIGLSSFRNLIEGNFLYVDKTKWIYELVRYPRGAYFLSRPRRFGKSLMVSTLEQVFLGNRDLFQGLWIDQSDYQWQPHPIIRLDFSLIPIKTADELETALIDLLQQIAIKHQITLRSGPYYTKFSDLISQLSNKGPVVILIDEYDKPLIDHLTNLEEAKKIREVLKGFYTIIKAMNAHIRFVLLTGISKFSKAGVFSSLNNLSDITLHDRFSSCVGITQNELESYFEDYILALTAHLQMPEDEIREKIKRWYNGFRFSRRGEAVYNPFSILSLFHAMDFSNYWFETGTPTFLINLIKEKQYELPQIENLQVDESIFSSYEIDNLNIIALLLQTGYLTIKAYEESEFWSFYRLYYPNLEVKNSFLKRLLASFSHFSNGEAGNYLQQLMIALHQKNFERFFEVLEVFFANIPYSLQIKNEKYYHTIFYLIFKLIGLSVHAEVETNKGRIDAVIELSNQVIIFEFKVNASAEKALQQAEKTKYYQKYQLSGKEIVLAGVNFDPRTRTIDSWKTKTIQNRLEGKLMKKK